MKAQIFYDLRELTGFMSGEELSRQFRRLSGDSSPKGDTDIPLMGELATKYDAEVRSTDGLATHVKEYTGIEIPEGILPPRSLYGLSDEAVQVILSDTLEFVHDAVFAN